MLQPAHALRFRPLIVITHLQHLCNRTQHGSMTTALLPDIQLNKIGSKAMSAPQSIQQRTPRHLGQTARRQTLVTRSERLKQRRRGHRLWRLSTTVKRSFQCLTLLAQIDQQRLKQSSIGFSGARR